ncbi:PAS domain S-box protein [Halorubrum sp. CGM5_25_10-8B]|uniref:bacterio-opsin activator domain-containing protein n=1 Tax=Halorubrum sp. CGM5_25_10-8B TaxID=2518115 RepID=UPI0010F4361C|nr:bacterio-opsin activator domain-containing protein [Halorubrum sp. CGM5_25_10-8B]TKX37657.1 PAS domain S-box protein [Halorubrum sp. CGM5_25_10-8B]
MSDAPEPGSAAGDDAESRVFQRLFEHTPDAVLVIDPEANRILRCNDRACELLGYDRERLLSLGPPDIHPHDYDVFEAFVERVRNRGSGFTAELSCHTRGGEVVPVDVTATTVRFEGADRILAIVRDASARTERERELRRRSAAMAAADDGIAVLNADGVVVHANAAYASLFGYDDPDAIAGAAWGELYATPDRFELDCRPAVVESGEWRGELTASRTDGDELPVRASVTGLEDGEFVCVARDVSEERRRERRLTGVTEASRELLAAADRDDVSRIAIRTVVGALGHEIACVRLYDPDANELVRTAMSDAAAALVRQAVAYDLKSSNAGAAYRSEETVRNESRTDDAYTDDPCRAEVHVPLGEFGVLSVFDREAPLTEEDVRLIELFAGVVRSALTRAERDERLRSRQDELERRREELSAADRFNTLVTEVIRSVLRATSGAAVRQSVCDELADSSLYEAAWIATVGTEDDADAVTIDSSAVATDSFSETDAESFLTSPFARQLVRQANERDAAVVQRRRFESENDTEAGAEADSIAAAVPVACGRQRFGVLAVAGTEESGFAEATQSGLELLGETLGFAIIADRRRNTLIESDAVELEFSFASPLGDLSAAFDCRCDHLGSVADGDDTHAYETRITHGDFDEIRSFLDEYPEIRECRLVECRGETCTVEITVAGAPPRLLAEAGFGLVSLHASDGDTRLIAEVPNDEDVTRVLDALSEYWDDVELVAKRQTPTRGADLPVPTDGAAGLTDRQRSVLETAYEKGYYDWPRDHTAEEIAEHLDIASATLHQHLRAAEHALVSSFVDDE